MYVFGQDANRKMSKQKYLYLVYITNECIFQESRFEIDEYFEILTLWIKQTKTAMDLIHGDVNGNRSILNNLGDDTNASEIDLIIQHGLLEISTQVSSVFVQNHALFLFV